MTISDEAIYLRERLAYIATRVEAVLGGLPALELPPIPNYEEYYAHPANQVLGIVEADLVEVELQAQEV